MEITLLIVENHGIVFLNFCEMQKVKVYHCCFLFFQKRIREVKSQPDIGSESGSSALYYIIGLAGVAAGIAAAGYFVVKKFDILKKA